MIGRPSKLTPESAEAFLSRYRTTGGNLPAAAEAAGLGVQTVRDYLARGEKQLRGQYRDFLEAVTKTRGEINGMLSGRLHKIAIGGLTQKPVCKTYTLDNGTVVETNEVIRDKDGQLQFKEVWTEADPRSIQWLLSRRQPENYANPEQRYLVQHSGDVDREGRRPAEVGSLLVDRFFGALATLKEHGAIPQLGPSAAPAIDVTTAPVPDPVPVLADTAPVESAPPDPDDTADLL
jgi:hypothetical protein